MLPQRTAKRLDTWARMFLEVTKQEIASSPKAVTLIKSWGRLGKEGPSLDVVDELVDSMLSCCESEEDPPK
jgi:hypothetical protein